MATIKFRDRKFKPDSLERIEQMLAIVADYEGQGLKLTARQLYYQFVSKDLIPNTERSYKNLTSLLADARYAGLIDWDAVEDRGREPTTWQDYDNLREAVDSVIRHYRLPRWRGQENYVELWVEKQALAGVLEPLASEFHATLMVNKGYSSASAMFAAAQRFMRECNQPESDYYDDERSVRTPILFYLGDHDPSGEDMVRDIRARLVEFGVQDIRVEKLALTMAQIRQYRPPPNPAKTSDARYEAYAAEHGTQSWEVDALPPNVLQQLIRSAFRGVINRTAMNRVIDEEKADKARLRAACGEVE
jgi:hypothetical protein